MARSRFVRAAEEFRPSPGTAYVLLPVTVFIWAVAVIIVRALHVDVPPVGLSWWRWFTAAVVILPFVWRDLIDKAPLIRKHLGYFTLLAASQMVGGTLMFIGVTKTTAINATLVNSTQPAMTAFMVWLIARHALGRLQGVGLVVALAGITVMVARADLDVLLNMQFATGDLIVIAGTVSYALYPVLLQRVPEGVGLTTLLFLVAGLGSVVLAPFAVAEAILVKPVPATPEAIAAILVLAILVSLISIFMWNAGNRAVGPNRASVFVNLLPAYGAVLAIIFLGEELFTYHIIGAAFVVGGILMVIRGHR